jgi:tRNA A37 threonylcarbamoyladenosine biosynthesis protein TsaE
MEQKKVKIIGLTLNNQLGILKAQQLTFNQDNQLIVVKGAVGSGKTTVQTALKLGTQGQKTLTDNQLYGDIDHEVQLLDGETPLFIGVKSKGKTLDYTIYQRDSEGKKVKNPIIDGMKATPSAYLNALQTKLTWRLDELTSENPKVQRDILLELYQKDLIKQGVIFDKTHPEYNKSILGKIDEAEAQRDYCDRMRKQKGGIKDDLMDEGINPDRPETCPSYIDVLGIDSEIKNTERDKIIFKTKKEQEYQNSLDNVENLADALRKDIRWYNSELEKSHDNLMKAYLESVNVNTEAGLQLNEVNGCLNNCLKYGVFLGAEHQEILQLISKYAKLPELNAIPELPKLIQIDPESNKIDRTTIPAGSEFEKRFNELVKLYTSTEKPIINLDIYNEKIEALQVRKLQAETNNVSFNAVESFREWQQANAEVVRLKGEYVQLMKNINTGVEGLKIVANEKDIYLGYDGSYDVNYFNNPQKELRKLASYSDTQKPIICLLVQNYLLSKKSKAMRYLFIDKVPIDKATRVLLDNMANELDLTLIVNWTGDFTKESLESGEFLIEGGEVFF